MSTNNQKAIAMAALANGMDWELFKTQKQWLVEQEIIPEVDGLLNFIDAVQDILTDDFSMDKYRLFHLMDDEGNFVKPAIDQFAVTTYLEDCIATAEKTCMEFVMVNPKKATEILTLINLNNQ